MSGHFDPPPPVGITKTASGYDVIFKSNQTGAKITMNVPDAGIFEDHPSRKITRKEVDDLAGKIVRTLDDYLV